MVVSARRPSGGVPDMGASGSKDDLERLNRENERLRGAVSELSILNDIATAIGSTSDLDRIIELIVRKCIKHLKVEQATITLLDTQRGGAQFRTIIRGADTSRTMLPYHLDAELTGWMLKNLRPLIVNDFAGDERFQTGRGVGCAVRSVLSAPLMLKGRVIGLLNLFNRRGGDFSAADARLLGIIAAQSAQIIENARLAAEEQSLILMQEEMRLAHKIQMDLLPRQPPRIAGYDIAGESIPAKVVGGDYFDFIAIDEDSLALCLGDVSGKGMPAALLMANLQATLRAQIARRAGPGECLERSNALLFRSTDDDKFATLFCARLDAAAHRLTYANAGHNHPLLVRAGGQLTRLELGGIVLGCLEDFRYQEGAVELQPRDLLLVYSDGITESMNPAEEEYGEGALADLVRGHGGTSARELIDTIVASVRAHAGSAPQSDDMTLLVIKRAS